MIPGRGVYALLGGKEILTGTPELLADYGAAIPEYFFRRAETFIDKGSTVSWLAIDRKAAGFIVLSDTLRPDAGKNDRRHPSDGCLSGAAHRRSPERRRIYCRADRK